MIKRMCLIFIAVVLLLSGCARQNDTPEKAVEYFIGCISELDFEKAESQNAEPLIIERIDQEAYQKRFGVAFQASGEHQNLNKRIAIFASSFLEELFMDDSPETKEIVEEFFATGDFSIMREGFPFYSRLSNLKLLRIDIPCLGDHSAEQDQNLQELASILGAESVTERIALLDLDGNLYMAGFRLYQFDGSWYIGAPSSDFAQMPSSGSAQPITEEEYLDHTRPQE